MRTGADANEAVLLLALRVTALVLLGGVAPEVGVADGALRALEAERLESLGRVVLLRLLGELGLGELLQLLCRPDTVFSD